MTTYVITVPGTFTDAIAAGRQAEPARELRRADPRRTRPGSEEDLDVLTVNEDNTFTIRLTVEAESGPLAERKARHLADSAVRSAGLDETTAPLGPAVITGIDSGIRGPPRDAHRDRVSIASWENPRHASSGGELPGPGIGRIMEDPPGCC
ncbi:hypothetical protein [Streptomyces chiangmaiensis]|uniref:Uncharacterized protein n=1 Tax=Streptomyces chiangmaiensis TaxID=766497 RepID=A0ABU7FP15_9ACTN|nr:hypothetical protein [Streptomyces chiangmaiensis]MED7825861.1 hypothetical protein [Streptomyces chiangmaiensis]